MGYYEKIIQAQTIDLMSNLENVWENGKIQKPAFILFQK